VLYRKTGPDIISADKITQAFWYPGAQHGGPLAALVVYLVEQVANPVTMQIVRLYMTLIRPVSVGDMRWELSVIKQGRMIQEIQIIFTQNHKPVLRATTLSYRVADVKVDCDAMSLPAQLADKGGDSITWPEQPEIHFAKDAVNISVVKGAPLRHHGEGAMWIRPNFDYLIDQEKLSPLGCVAMVSDFGNALSSLISVEEGRFINADLSMEALRAPVDDHLLLQAQTMAYDKGFGVVKGKIYDSEGLVALCHQTILLERN